MSTDPSPMLPSADAGALCDLLRSGGPGAGDAMEALRDLGAAAVPALRTLLDERGAGYAYAVRVLASLEEPDAVAALRQVCGDPAARDCDRFEAAAALLERGDGDALESLRRLAGHGSLRSAAYFLLRARPDGFQDADLALGPYLDDPEIRPLVVEDLLARGYETGGTLDEPAARERFREGWRAGTVGAGGGGDGSP